MSAADGDLTGIPKPTHLDAEGKAHMVDVGAKDVTARTAVAEASGGAHAAGHPHGGARW
jgi:hypothetical protein